MKLTEEQKTARRAKREENKREADRVSALLAEARAVEIEQARERERQRWLPKVLRVVNRGLLDVPVWCTHRRAKNWAAIVEIDPTAPAGLSRKWLQLGRGLARYVVPEQLEPGVVIEFAADYVSYGGKKDPNRIYAVVLSVSETALTIQPYASADQAFAHKLVRIG